MSAAAGACAAAKSEARSIVEGFGAHLADKKRGDPVLRHSVDWLSPKALRPRLIGDGSHQDEHDCHKAVELVVCAWQAESAAAGPARYRGAIGQHGVRVFQVVLKDMQKRRDGKTDLAYSQIAEATGIRDTDTVMYAYHAYDDFGIMTYIRRTAPTGAPKQFGVPQRAQISSIAYLTPERLRGKWRVLYEQELARLRGIRQAARNRAALKAAVADRREAAAEGGTPPRKRARPEAFTLAKMNPVGARRAVQAQMAADVRDGAEEAATAEWVARHAAELREQMLARCG